MKRLCPLRSSTTTAEDCSIKDPTTSRDTAALFGCLFIILALRWHLIWNIGFYQDDAVSSSWLFEARATGRTTLAFCWDTFQAFVTDQGRITPIYNLAIQPLIMVVGERLWLFRLLQSAFHIAALIGFALWLKRAGASTPYLYLCVVTIASIYEVRDYHDASFGQAMTLPTVALLGFLALERAEALRDGHALRSSGSVVACSSLSLAAVLTHDFGLAFAVAATSTVLFAPGSLKQRFTLAATVLAPSLIVTVVGLQLKRTSLNQGTSFGSSSPQIIALTFLKQALATLPFSYAGVNPSALEVPAQTLYVPNVVLGALGGVLVAVLCLHCSRSDISLRSRSVQAASAILLIVSAGLTSVSAKYQRELAWGIGYMQIYIQYFGLAVLLVGGFGCVLRRASLTRMFFGLRWPCRALMAIGLGCTFFASFSHSGVVGDYINQHWRYPREVLAVVLADQSRLRLPSRVEIRVDRTYLQRWENFYFLFQHTGWHGRFLISMDPVVDGDPRVERLRIRYPVTIDKTDIVLVVFSEFQSPDGHTPNAKPTIYVLCKDRRKLDLAFVPLVSAPSRIALRDLPTYSARGWAYKRIEISQAGFSGSSEQYGIGLF